VVELFASAADEAARALELHVCALTNALTGFLGWNAVDTNAAFHDEAACLRTRDALVARDDVVQALTRHSS
jgi:hypothetical protein